MLLLLDFESGIFGCGQGRVGRFLAFVVQVESQTTAFLLCHCNGAWKTQILSVVINRHKDHLIICCFLICFLQLCGDLN